MAGEDIRKDNINTKSNLINPDDIEGFLNIGFDEVINDEEGPTIGKGDTLGNSWIVGSSTNSIVGVNTGTQGGGQQVVGADSRVQTIQRVVNPNNIFHEHFRDNNFEDTGVTTADWDTVNFKIDLTSGEIAQSLSTFLNLINIDNAKLILTGTNITNLTLQLASDGTNFETVTNNELHSFTTIGQDLKFKLIATGNATITEIKLEYNKG